MSRSIHRRSLFMRLLSVYVILVVAISFAGFSYAAPAAPVAQDSSAESTQTPPPVEEVPAEEPIAEEAPAEEPPVEEAVAPDATPEETVTVEPAVVAEESSAVTKSQLTLIPEVLTTADIGSGDVNLEGVRKGTGWIKGNLHSYQEGEWVPFRLWIRNASDATVTVPALTVDAFHYKDGKGIYFDRTGDYLYYITGTEPAQGDATLPQPEWTPLALTSHDVPSSGTYGVDAPDLLTTITGGQVDIPPNEYAVLYYRGHLALTAYWNLQDPPRDGWGPYTGSPGNMQIDGLGEKTVPLPAVEAPEGTIDVVKFYDTNHDGVMDPGEDPLPDWTIHVKDTGDSVYTWDLVQDTGADGHATFYPLPPGDFIVYEDLKDGWSTSTTQPVQVTIDGDETETVYIGNYLPDVTKNFELTYNGSAPANTTFYVAFKVDGADKTLALTGSGPYTASADYPYGSEITEVEWFATWQYDGSSVDISLGTSSGETLEEEVTNMFTYGGMLDGYKYEDLDADGVLDPGESGLEGWEIVLERKVDDVWYPYDTTLTDANGYYEFDDVLPGSYRVSETLKVDYDWTQSYPADYHLLDFSAAVVGQTSGTTYHDKDFLNWAPASIEGMKFEDLDADGEHDVDEPGLEGWIIYVDYNGNDMHDPGEPYDVTDSNGHYSITDITPGTYTVREVLPGDWFQSFGTYVVEFQSRGHYGEQGEYDFGNWTYASKSGMKFLDKDADGVKDAGEPGLEGWTIFVDYDDDGVLDMGEPSDVTNASGNYSISGIQPGLYKVREVQQMGWTQSYPETGYYEVGFTSGLEDTGNDFGNWSPLDPWGYKWHDLDGDGVWDNGEPGLEGWEIHLDGTAGSGAEVHLVVYTDATGFWQFHDVPPGEYVISEITGGWMQSFPGGLGYYEVTLNSLDEQEVGYDFGNWTSATKSGTKFEDMDADGVYDMGEPGLPGWIIYADYNDNSQLDNDEPFAITDSNGYYELTDIDPGTWPIRELMKVDYDWTQSMPGAPDYAYVEEFDSESAHLDNDFGNWAPASIEGTKFEDLDADGVFDLGESGLEGWRIFVDYNGNDTYDVGEPTALTDSNGYYSITDITPGTYEVREVLESDWHQSRGNFTVEFTSRGMYGEQGEYDFGNWYGADKSGMKFEDLDADGVKDAGEPGLPGWTIYVDYNDNQVLDNGEPSAVTDGDGMYSISGIEPGTYMVREVMQSDWTQSMPGGPDFAYEETFESRDSFVDNDFGNWAPASIQGMKFEDLNADGVEDQGEPGLSGWTIYVDYNNNEMLDNGEPFDITDSNGMYEITGVTPGTYWVREVQQNDWNQSLGDFEVEFMSRGMYGLEGEYDFGNWQTARLEGTKFHDLNGNGVWDEGEPGLEGWEIHLIGVDGMAQGDEATTTTDVNGDYSFEDLTPGRYVISEILQPDWTQSYPVPDSYDVTLVSGEDPEMTFDFGNWTTTSFFGYKFHDLDADGIWDQPAEEGLMGWLIELEGTTGAGDPYYDAAITDAMGYYEFTDVPPGEYTISEVQKPYWTQTAPEGDVFDVTGISNMEPEESLDFGNAEDAEKFFELTYVGTVPDDTTMTVTFDVMGPIMEDVGIALDAFGPQEIVLEPQGDGTYTGSFDVVPGTVISGIEWWAIWNGELIKLGDGSEMETINGPVLNEFEYDADAYGFKWDDTDQVDPATTLGQGDGIWDQQTEPALPDWTIELYRMDAEQQWALYATTMTDSNGEYMFDGLLPGTYYLAEVIPLDPVSNLPMWNQSAGPAGVGDGAFVVTDDTTQGPVNFGNWTPIAPLTIDIGIEKTVNPTTVNPGGTLDYTLKYTMVVGGIVDEPITIVDDYDETKIEIVDANGGVVSNGTITWTFNATLANGESGTIGYTARVLDDVTAGTRIDNVAVITMAGDSNPANNTDDASVQVQEPFLPFTGADLIPAIGVLLAALVLGVLLRRRVKA